ncbi:MAG: T9SS type A sorting domain-containing protein [Ignavibacteriae bacterium]|nr:T9SS type A sorting domain-containing protein [Ignavibacteriota bacterium]
MTHFGTGQLFQRFIHIFTLLVFFCTLTYGQWSRDSKVNTPVSTTRNNQTLPKIVSDGASGAIVLWQDTRDSSTLGINLYAQRLNSRGVVQWTNNGIFVTRATGNQLSARLVSDGRGGAIVVWQDTRNGNTDIYAQHISSDSTKLWTANGIPICTEVHEQNRPIIETDNLGGAIIVWQDYRNGNADLFAQHIDAGGNVIWTPNGVPVCTAGNDQVEAAIVSDDANGAIVVWQDLRNNADYNIFAQRIRNDGAMLWAADGVTISSSSNHQRFPAIAADGNSGAFMVWEDYRFGFSNVFLQRVDTGGTPLLTANGIRMTSIDADQTLPQITSDGVGGVIVAWDDMRDGNQDIYSQRVDGAGGFQWTSDGLAICTASGQQGNLAVTTDGSSGAILTWEDSRTGIADIFAQRVLSNGSTLWATNGVGICTDTLAQANPTIVDNNAHGAIMTWQDYRKLATQGIDVYAQLINADGTIGGFSIHGIIFDDFNQNGVQDAGEPGLKDWKVNATGASARSDTSDSTGAYVLDGLTPGIYVVKQEIKPGWIQTSATDSIVNLSIGGDSIRNFGNFQLSTISGRAYKDRNRNGILDAGEAADSGRLIRLTGSVSMQTTTDRKGLFSFVGLTTGTFFVKESISSGSGLIQTSQPDSFLVVLNTIGQDDTGLVFGNFLLGTVTGKVYNDAAGDSAIIISPTKFDSTIAGWNVRLYKNGIPIADAITNGTGAYNFSNLDTGRYVVRETLFVGWIQTYPKPPGDTIVPGGMRAYKIQIDTSSTTLNNRDFANFKLGIISGRQYEDVRNDSAITGDPTLPGWRVKLFKDGIGLDSAYTDNTGSVTFTNLFAGTYTVEESLFSGWRQTFPRLDTSLASQRYGVNAGPRAHKVTMTSGKNSLVNFGNFRFGSVRGSVYMDVGRDSLILGDPPIPGWLVSIFKHVFISGTTFADIFLKDTVTDISGAYVLTDLDFGQYRVAESLMISSIQTYPRIGMPGVVLKSGRRVYDLYIDSSGEFDMGRDFGNYTGYITGTVFNDINGDGIQEVPDTGMPGVVVRLAGIENDSTVSDNKGNYSFIGLDNGTYYIAEDIPAGWTKTTPKSKNFYTTSVTNVVKYIPGLDFGNFRMGTISGRVFYDLDSNGHRDPDEPGLSGRVVILGGTIIDSIVTDANGAYSFSGLPIGLYTVKQVAQQGWIQTVPADSQLVVLASGESAPNVDFGNTGLGRIRGIVFNDLNRNGAKAVAEPGIANWQLRLRSALHNDLLVTDANGNFIFPRLSPDVYTLTQVLQQGWIKTSPSTSDGWSVTITPALSVTGKDFGDFKLGLISGMIFNDHSGDGVRDPQDSGLANFTVYLAGQRIDSVLSDAHGDYTFANLDTGKYTVREQLQPYWIRTLPKAVDFYRDTISISGTVKTVQDFGNMRAGLITGVIYNDNNSNGVRDSGEMPLDNWKLHLVRIDGEIVGDSIAHSAVNGVYQFTGLSPGMYIVLQEIPAGWFQTAPASPEVITISTNGQIISGKDFGNFFFSMSGIVFDDYNGDGVRDQGEPGRNNVRLYLRKNGSIVDSVLTNASGAYALGSRGTGTYSITQMTEAGWTITSTPASIIVDHSSGLSLTDQNFGNFKKVSVSGLVFEDNNRNGARDQSELGIVQTIISLYRNGILFARDTSLSDGSYQIDDLTPGNYSLYQEKKTGYVKSFPVSPDSFKFITQSGVSLSGKNFGIYLMLSRSITVRSFRDNDGNMATTDDRVAQPWTLNLYRSGILLKTTTAASLDTNNLSDGTYVVQQADSSGAGYLSIGKLRTIHFSSSPDSLISFMGAVLEDTIVLHAGESHITDFINTKPGQVVVQAFSDVDTKFSTSGDRAAQQRHLELYSNFVAPANLLQSVNTDSVLTVSNLGGGRYVARQIDSTGWRNIGRTVDHTNRSAAADTIIFNLAVGGTDTVGFVNAGEGTLLIRKFIDADGDTATTDDRGLYTWNLLLLKDSSATPPKIDSVYADSLRANLLVGNYIAKEIVNPQWNTIGTYRDGFFIGKKDTARVTIGSGENHLVDFVNSTTLKTKTWMANADAQWQNNLNWSPPVIPIAGDSVIIRADRPWRVPMMPERSILSTIAINPSAALELPSEDTVVINGDLINNGSLIAGANDTPVILLNGDYKGQGTFTPGHSMVIISSGLQRRIDGGRFHNLQIGNSAPPVIPPGNPPEPPASPEMTDGNLTIDGILVLNDDLDATGDTIFIVNNDPAAIQGHGTVIGGTIVRSIQPVADLFYRYHYDSSYVRFTAGSPIPEIATMKVLPDTTPVDFGTTWDSVSAALDTSRNSIMVSGVSSLSVLRPWAFGIKSGNGWVPVIRRVYVIQSQPDTGFSADLCLRYEQQDIPPGTDEGSLTLLRLRLVYVQVTDSTPGGWNMVSLPVRMTDTHITTIFSGAVSEGFRFDATAGYVPENSMINGFGYWVNLPASRGNMYYGLERTRDSLSLPAGWSLFGTLSTPLDVRSVRSQPPGNLSNIFGFSGGYTRADSLRPGKAYWVKLTNVGKLVLDNQIPPVAKVESNDIPGNLNTLRVRDARGNEQTLFFGSSSEMHSRSFELPPCPPEGIFDVRFADNQSVELYPGKAEKAANFRILFSSAVYPVEVRWKLANERSEQVSLAQILDRPGERMTLGTGNFLKIDNPNVKALQLTIEGKRQIPTTFALYQCYPNPFNPTTRIDFDLPEPSVVTLKVYDILGREVTTLLDGVSYADGTQSVIFNAGRYASGVYMYRIEVAGEKTKFRNVKKMVLIK